MQRYKKELRKMSIGNYIKRDRESTFLQPSVLQQVKELYLLLLNEKATDNTPSTTTVHSKERHQ